jgi:serine/threonine protein kinase
MEKMMTVNGIGYEVVSLLGHGKGGYSYLVQKDDQLYVLKQIHHEPCSYYTFGNKIEAEQTDYIRLQNAGIRIPQMLDIDIPKERILKQYIPGPTIYDLVKAGKVKPQYFDQVRHMAWQAQQAGLNIDYFPTNFVVWEDTLYYVDYECNLYDPRWNFENWGNNYWWQSPEFEDYVNQNTDI